jgi:hypothetical protein
MVVAVDRFVPSSSYLSMILHLKGEEVFGFINSRQEICP